MTDTNALAAEARLDAKAFRENTVYDSEGDPIRLIANADRLDAYADALERAEQALTERDAEIARLREALIQHNDRLRSAIQIAERDGKDTNWVSFRGQCHYTAAEYHALVNEAHDALDGEQP